MTAPRKVFTEAMIRRVLKAHFEIDPPQGDGIGFYCECGLHGSNFDDHFIDQLHKLWHEMFSRKPTTETERLSV